MPFPQRRGHWVGKKDWISVESILNLMVLFTRAGTVSCCPSSLATRESAPAAVLRSLSPSASSQKVRLQQAACSHTAPELRFSISSAKC